MSTDTQTQSIPRVPAAVAAVTDARVATRGGDAKVAPTGPDTEATAPTPQAEVAVPEPDAEVAATDPRTGTPCEEPVEHMYEAALAKLAVLHDRWAAAMAEIRQASASGEPGEAAA